jgi:hypothetical protein
MRLQLTLLALLGAAAWAGGVADVTASSKVQVYADNDRTVVVSPHVNASGTLKSTGTSVTASYTEDVVSSASVDVRSSASPRIYDRRQEIDVGLGQKVLGADVAAVFVHSLERDYLSNGGALSFSRDLAQRNTTLALRLGYTANVVGRAEDPNWRAPMTDLSADLALTQLFTATTIAQLNVTAAGSSGFNASPYRKVWVATGQYALPEAEPAVRDRLAVALGLKQYLLGFTVLQLEYRFYADSWKLLSHTADLRWVFDFDTFNLRLRYRLYVQNGAWFYQSHYDEVLTYLSADRELSPFSSHLFGVKFEWLPKRSSVGAAQLRLDLKVEGMYFAYSDFPALTSRWALITQAGAAVDF